MVLLISLSFAKLVVDVVGTALLTPKSLNSFCASKNVRSDWGVILFLRTNSERSIRGISMFLKFSSNSFLVSALGKFSACALSKVSVKVSMISSL